MAGALADEKSALALPLDPLIPNLSEEAARQLHRNTNVRQWGVLEQEFPAYAEYLRKHGSPEPQLDTRHLDSPD